MSDCFLCDDAECWITPEITAQRRRHAAPELACHSVVLYTPLDMTDDAGHWVVDALAPGSARAWPRARGTGTHLSLRPVDVELPGGALTAMVGPMGAPATVAALEGAIGLGARQLLFFGICGSLQPDLHIGDLILAERAIREEGTSFHYLPADEPAVAAPRLLSAARERLDAAGLAYRAGTTWTTDAPYRETRTKVARLATEGVLGVEMEVSAVYALATFRRIEALALLVVSDQLVGEEWTGITRDTFREHCDQALRILAEVGLRSAPARGA